MNSKKTGYSLIEVLISMSVIGILVLMMFNIILLSFQVSIAGAYISQIGESLDAITSSIARDIRNSSEVRVCQDSRCEFVRNNIIQSWELCDEDNICKFEYSLDGSRTKIFQSSNKFTVSSLLFQNVSLEGSDESTTIVSIALSSTETYGLYFEPITLVNQISITQRNFRL